MALESHATTVPVCLPLLARDQRAPTTTTPLAISQRTLRKFRPLAKLISGSSTSVFRSVFVSFCRPL